MRSAGLSPSFARLWARLAILPRLAALKLAPPGTEEVPLEEALGRVLAEDVVSPVDVPGFEDWWGKVDRWEVLNARYHRPVIGWGPWGAVDTWRGQVLANNLANAASGMVSLSLYE